jgi:hypothetical protein
MRQEVDDTSELTTETASRARIEAASGRGAAFRIPCAGNLAHTKHRKRGGIHMNIEGKGYYQWTLEFEAAIKGLIGALPPQERAEAVGG